MQQFCFIASEYLYTDITTDDLPGLLLGALSGKKSTALPIPGNKLRLLTHCRTLHLEPSKALYRSAEEGNIRTGTHVTRNSMAAQAKVFRAAADLGGFSYFFPNLTAVSLSAFTRSQRIDSVGVGGDLWAPTSRTREIYAAWAELMSTLEVLKRCCTVGRGYPLPGNELDAFRRLPHQPVKWDDHVEDEAPGRQPRRVNYIHADDTTFTFYPPFNIRNLYLYPCTLSRPDVLLSRIAQRARYMLTDLVEVERRDNLDAWLDVVFCIPITAFAKWKHEPSTNEELMREIKQEMAAALRYITDWYYRPKLVRRKRDRWTIRVTDGQVRCPVCERVDGVEVEEPVVLFEQMAEWQLQGEMKVFDLKVLP